jgi:hypothetical protein
MWPEARGRWPRHRGCRGRHRSALLHRRTCSKGTARAAVHSAGRYGCSCVEEGRCAAGVAGRRIRRHRVEGVQRPVDTHCPSAATDTAQHQPHHPPHSGNVSRARRTTSGGRSGRRCAVGGHDTACAMGDTGWCRRAPTHATRAQRVQRRSSQVDTDLAVSRRAGGSPALPAVKSGGRESGASRGQSTHTAPRLPQT